LHSSNLEPFMSALGQKRTLMRLYPMSALPPKGRLESSFLHRETTKGLGRTREAMGSMNRCPLYPQKRTSLSTVVMSALCQKRTHAVQQISAKLKRGNAYRQSRFPPPWSVEQ
jgi:hypothetical protein